MPPAFESRVSIHFRCGPTDSKQFVQSTRELIKVVFITARIEILEAVFALNQASLVNGTPYFAVAIAAQQTSLHKRFNTLRTVMSRRLTTNLRVVLVTTRWNRRQET